MSIKLNLADSMYVGGQTLRGDVELHFPEADEDHLGEVHVKLRGAIHTYVCISRRVPHIH